MIRGWLKETKRTNPSYPKFSVIDFTENDMNEQFKELKRWLARQILIHLDYPTRLIRIFRNESKHKLRQHIIKQVLPKNNAPFNPKQSFFCEIITADILEKIRKAKLPIYKLRYKELKDRAMGGKADVLACNIISGKPVLIFAEVKSKITYDKGIAIEAYQGLNSNNVEIPEIVEYVSRRLEDNDKYNLANLFDKAILNPKSYHKDFHIFLVFEKAKWKDDVLEVLANFENTLPNLTVNVVLICSLSNLINEIYKLIPKVAEEIVYYE